MIYVDTLREWGWKIRGKEVKSCHMFASDHDIDALVDFGKSIGLRPEWLQTDQGSHRVPHFDLTETKWRVAVRKGAIPVSDAVAVETWRAYEDHQAALGFELVNQFMAAGRSDHLAWLESLSKDQKRQVGFALRYTGRRAVETLDHIVDQVNAEIFPTLRALFEQIQKL